MFVSLGKKKKKSNFPEMAFEEECALVYCYCVSNEGNYNFQCDLEGKVILGVN